MRKFFLWVGLFSLFAGGAQAALIDRGEGFIYDDIQDITWAQDTNINGVDTWDNQVAWVSGYSQTHTVYGTFDDWRLPTTLQPDPGCDVQQTFATGVVGQGAGCSGSEMGHLYAVDGIRAGFYFPLLEPSPLWYWSATQVAHQAVYYDNHWAFLFSNGGIQYSSGQFFVPDEIAALAVRDGDIALVPEPNTALLLGIGLAGLGMRRRRTRRGC